MYVEATRGRGAYRCGCGIRIAIVTPEPRRPARWTGCVAEHEGGWCQATVAISKPVRLCEEHYESSGLQQYHEWRFLKRRDMARLVVEMEFEEWGVDLHAFERPETIRAARLRSEGLRPPDPKNAIVYFIECGNYIKIGTTVNLRQRLASLTLPEKPTVLLTVPGHREKETEFHRRFRHLQSNGEWFHRGADLLEFIEAESAQKTA